MVVSEALSVGSPVVCVSHGGPGELIRYWPTPPSAGIKRGPVDATARPLAQLSISSSRSPPPIAVATVRPTMPLGVALLGFCGEAGGRCT